MLRASACSAIAGIALAASLCVGCRTSEPPNVQLNDAKITAEVKAKLASDVSPSSLANVDVNTTNGIVSMAGQVESDTIRQRAVEVARSVDGVQSVNNNLQVQPRGYAQRQPDQHQPQ